MVDMLFMQKQQNNSLNFMYTYDDMHDNFLQLIYSIQKIFNEIHLEYK